METRTTVKGILQDSLGKPLRDATIMIADGPHEFNDIATVTNDSGEFYLSNIVVPGKYLLQIATEAQSKTKEINVSTNETISVRF